MITLAELNPHQHGLTPDIQVNLEELRRRLSLLQDEWKRPMIITSGYRSADEQRTLYAQLGRKPPMGSAHLVGKAADVFDRDKSLWRWVVDHLDLMAKIGLWMEDGTRTSNWVHFQTVPPNSGHRIFMP